MRTQPLLLWTLLGSGCGTEVPRWINMNTEVVDGDETSDDAPVVVYGTASETVEPSTDTGIAAPTSGGSTGLFVQHSSNNSVCYIHVHACGVDSGTEQACGQGETASLPITDTVDVLGDKLLQSSDNAQIWLNEECVSVFAVDCEQLRCWSTGDIDLTAGNQTILLKG